MDFFENFPKLFYPAILKSNGVYDDFREMPNLMIGIRFREILAKYTSYYYTYTIEDGDRPDIISAKYYGTADYTWIILLINNILDPLYDWPLDYYQFITYLKKKYGSIDSTQTTIKEYYNKNSFVIDHQTWLNTPEAERSQKTIYEWENDKNEAKRDIKILDNTYLNKVLSEFRDLLNNELGA